MRNEGLTTKNTKRHENRNEAIGERSAKAADARRGGSSRHPYRADKGEFVKEAE